MKFNILISVYNQEELIVNCINSIPKRDDLEIIICDDCSTDNTIKSIESLHRDDIKLIRNKKNLGVGVTRNVLLDNANCDYIFFLDSDDFLYTDVFNSILNNFDSSYDIVRCLHRQNNGHTWFPKVHRGDFIRRSLIGKLRFKDMRCHEDTVFRFELDKKTSIDKVRLIDEVAYHYNFPRKNSLTWIDRNYDYFL